MAAAPETLRATEGVEVPAGPTGLHDGSTAGPSFIDFRTPWGLIMEVIEAPASMPDEAEAAPGPGTAPPA